MAQRLYARLNAPRHGKNNDNLGTKKCQNIVHNDDIGSSNVSKKIYSPLVIVTLLLVTLTFIAFFMVYRQRPDFLPAEEIRNPIQDIVELPRNEPQSESSLSSDSEEKSSRLTENLLRVPVSNNATNIERKRERRKQPYWMNKYPSLPDENEVSSNHRICFVHVGKTAGSSLACYLGFQYDCGLAPRFPEGNLPQYTTNIMHTKYDNCQGLDFAYYLYVVREPLSRIQSWWTYERPTQHGGRRSSRWVLKKPLFIDCGWYTLNEMAGSTGLASTIPTECSRRAWSAIRGEVGYSVHNSYNFQKYYSQIPKDAKLIVLRTEHLLEDYNKAEMLIDGKPLVRPFPKKNKSVKEDADRILSERSRELLCEGLCQEILMYKHILRIAVNLDEDDYQISLSELLKTCPKQAKADRCDM